ncbi:Uncharacterized protein TPAR_01418 [Tolypocladium paradoxum]|uniref:MYND-type domain-containing protein n=1 Tax=Tolypocladium paradoxum TaxID=94208 RepID=A0A2S4L7F3_9HYPO|nr:Uncharacterized protein TPAR_01418 [Tolypocladium paradoxum]
MDPSCKNCNKGAPEVTLKRCAKCSTTSYSYCSRDCQKADWKSHKKVCGKPSGSAEPSARGGPSSASSSLSPPKGLDRGVAKPFTRLDNGTWLHDRSETDVYRLLIDAYRLRVEDTYTVEGDIEADSIYGGAPDGRRGLGRFLDLATRRRGLLPPWWNPEKRAACVRLGMDASQWCDLRCAVEKSDIVDHYGDRFFPMQLRMFAEAVIGRGPGGMPGASMRQMMMAMEGGLVEAAM